ncbi:MAG: 30S ribosomal protein S5 [Candidatus Spechtbacterales bacterium]|nr:30S ribosomal protein S5 [Candidatus Spechtbacterales bacterium]
MAKQKTKNRGRRPRRKKEPQEFDNKVLDIARVARVVAGGRRFSFRSVVVVGDRKGRVGVGIGKGSDVSISIGKATRNAKKNVMHVPMTPEGTIPYDIKGKQSATVVYLKPARRGRGIIAGGAVRTVCDLAGFSDITAKVLSRSTNKLNMALATVNALERIDYTAPKTEKKESKKEEDNNKKAENKKPADDKKSDKKKKTTKKTAKKKKKKDKK